MRTKTRMVPCPYCHRLFEVYHEPKKSDKVHCPYCHREVTLFKRG